MPIAFTTATEAPAGTEVLGVPVFAGPVVADNAGVELDLGFLTRQGFEARVGDAVPMLADDGGTVIAVGMGPRGEVDLDAVRRAAAAFTKAAWHESEAAFVLPAGLGGSGGGASSTQAVVEGIGLSAYQVGLYKSAPKPCQLRSVAIVGGEDRGVARGAAAVDAVTFARDLVNEPAGAMPPSRLADAARAVADKAGLEIDVLDERAIEREALGGLLGVSRGSAEPPRLIRMEWSPPRPTATVVLVGKGITFDSGGLSIKSGEGMMHMKGDMAGAAAVLATMAALPTYQPDVRVIGIVPATENMPGGRAIKPGDVLRFRNGKTAEVLNTDAEGRLVLADALSLAVEAAPDAIVDLATLTGACVSALGREIAGVMGNDDGIVGQVLAASEHAGEPMWHLPLPKRYRKHIDSDIADIKNIGVNGQAGALSAGLFLQEFVADVPWAHLDIAGPSWSDAVDGYIPRGGTGVGVRTLLELLDRFEKVR